MSQNEYEERKPIIYLAGIGMGQDDQLTGEVLDCLDRADAVMGARRMLDAAAPYTEGKAVLAAYKPSEMVKWLSSFEWDEAVLWVRPARALSLRRVNASPLSLGPGGVPM